MVELFEIERSRVDLLEKVILVSWKKRVTGCSAKSFASIPAASLAVFD